MATIECVDLVKRFGVVVAVVDFSLSVGDGEFVVLVGPSGCGKSTTLRMIAGLETVDEGTIAIDGRIVNRAEPKDRNIAMVFQNYAIYPHMTVAKNIGFGLYTAKLSRKEKEERIKATARILELDELLGRRPAELSGGQRQRVAIGRAMVRDPAAFLFDEPLSNLDAQLRAQMRIEIKKLHQRLRSTVVYVTHDQVEAMTMADRIVVMRNGRILQAGGPAELYERPADVFTARFIGSPTMNIIGAEVTSSAGALVVAATDRSIRLDDSPPPFAVPASGRVLVGVRPQDLVIADADAGDGSAGMMVSGEVSVSEPLGSETFVHIDTGEQTVIASTLRTAVPKVGEPVRGIAPADRLVFFDADSEKSLPT